MKVQCIDNDDSPTLDLNRVYEVDSIIGGYYALQGIAGIWRATRFTTTINTKVKPQIQRCACGIARQDCTYHKDS